MSKTRTIEWLESQTGQTLLPSEPAEETRHLSLRIGSSLFDRLEALATQNSETVSQVARRLLDRGVDSFVNPDHEAIDSAIATLEHLRSKLASKAA